MTCEELKQEAKETEGDPHVKGRIRSHATRGSASPHDGRSADQADVIVTNPTHFAVALAYKNGMGRARRHAKGMGEVARRIRELGPNMACRCSRRHRWRARCIAMSIRSRDSRNTLRRSCRSAGLGTS